MPNLVSIATRIDRKCKIICFYTINTKEIFKKLKFIIEEKIKESKEGEKNLEIEMKGLEIIHYNKVQDVEKQLQNREFKCFNCRV